MQVRSEYASGVEESRDEMTLETVRVSEADVLVIEDAPGMRDFLEELLSECGFEAAGVPSGVDGITVVEQFSLPEQLLASFDLIVLDWCLPGMSGDQVLEWLRNRGSTVPVLVISSFFDNEVLEQANQLGASTVLSKPFRVRDFLDTVKALTA